MELPLIYLRSTPSLTVISFLSDFSIVHQYIQHFNEVSGNKSGKIKPWLHFSFIHLQSVTMLGSVTVKRLNEHFQPTVGYY